MERRSREAIHVAAQVWRAAGWGEREALGKSLARFLYCSRMGVGGSGSASCGFGNMAKLLSMRLESALGQAERRFVAFVNFGSGGHGPFRGLEAPFALRESG